MSNTTEPTMADIAVNTVKDTAGNIGIATGPYSQATRDALDDYAVAIAETIAVGYQAEADLEELNAKKDLVPAHGYDRLRGELIADAETRSADALRRAEQAEARFRESLLADALPKLDPAREALARQELTLAFDGGDGAILARVANIAQYGSREAVAVLLGTGFGETLLASRGAKGRELNEALTTGRTLAAGVAAERGETERERAAGAALRQIGKLGAARTAAHSHVKRSIGAER
jgi:hypothetical protein